MNTFERQRRGSTKALLPVPSAAAAAWDDPAPRVSRSQGSVSRVPERPWQHFRDRVSVAASGGEPAPDPFAQGAGR
jgi:hypothetical protein